MGRKTLQKVVNLVDTDADEVRRSAAKALGEVWQQLGCSMSSLAKYVEPVLSEKAKNLLVRTRVAAVAAPLLRPGNANVT